MRSAENCWHAAHADVRQIARLPEQRCWQKRQSVGKLPTVPAAGQKADFRAKKIFPADVLRAFDNTHARASTRKNCLYGNEPGGSRTHDLLLRRAKKRSPLSASECLQMPKYQRFPPFSDVRISSKNRLFYPVRVSRVLAASNFGGRPFSHDVRFC